MTKQERQALLERWDDEIPDGPFPRWGLLFWLGWPAAVVVFFVWLVVQGC